MKKYNLSKLEKTEIEALLKRPAINFGKVMSLVEDVLRNVKKNGDKALSFYTKKFDGVDLSSFAISQKEIAEACRSVSKDVQIAFKLAAKNIEKFHKLQIQSGKKIETMPGVNCYYDFRPIERVGIYIPGGTAPLPSTVLMLGIPAKIAGCKEVIMCTPPGKDGKVNDLILFAASICGIKKIFKIGGAQAIGAMAYGTDSVLKVDKIFGPGNQYVTAAKMVVSIDPAGVPIDMPAGPTEVLVIADKEARADFVASDLLSQAEHGIDSQVVLVSNSNTKIEQVLAQIEEQISTLPRINIAEAALKNSFALLVDDVDEAIEFSNSYAPEHLILNVKNYKKYLNKIQNAGSVFLGQYSCESAGDYASGTNHCLPTYGYAKSFSGVSLASFKKQITFQELSFEGAKKLGPTVALMAEQEELIGHKRAMEIRYK